MNDRILERIRKCLALAASSEPHEAAAALRQAQALMRRHEIAEDDPRLELTAHVGSTGVRADTPPAWLSCLINLVGDAFGVANLYRPASGKAARVEWIGRAPRPAVACYAFEVLARQLRRDRARFLARNRRFKRTTRIRRADAFAWGWVSAAAARVSLLAEGMPSGKAVAAFHAARGVGTELVIPRDRTISGRDLAAVAAGAEAGESAMLHHGVDAGCDPAMLLDARGGRR